MNAVELAALTVLAPLVVAVFLIVAAPVRRNGVLAPGLSVLGSLVSLVGAGALLLRQIFGLDPDLTVERQWLVAGGETVARVGITVDGTSAAMLAVVTFVAAMVQIFSLGYLSDEPEEDRGRYFTWQSLFLFSMLGLVVSPNLLQLFACWELVGLCSYLLIGYWWRKPSAAKAAVKAFWVTKFADMGLLIGLVLLYYHTGAFEWGPGAVEQLAAAGSDPEKTPWVLPSVAVAGLMFFAVMGKSAQFPLHVWLPDAMEGPTPVSALLHAATMVAAGVYLIVRAWPLFEAAPVVLNTMAIVGGLTALLAACMAIIQTDIKRVLAYSTASQLGYMIAALGAGSVLGGFFHLTTHAFFKALLFLSAGSVIHAVHTNELSEMGGLWKPMKLTALAFGVGAAALAGLPLMSGFTSKDLVLEGLYKAASAPQPVLWFPFLACLFTVGLTSFYMSRVFLRAFFGKSSRRAYRAHEGGWSMRVPMMLLAVPAVAAGWPVATFAQTTGLFEPHIGLLHFTPVGGIALGFSVVGFAVALMVHASGGSGGMVSALSPLGDLIRLSLVDRAYDLAYRQALNIAAGVGWFDRYMVDGVVNAIGALTLLLGRWSRHLQTGRVGDYVYAVVGGLVLLAAWSQMISWVVL
ncbi:MAG TPA: NADH-quinone oxidoreductase subunit L [Deltaproteobacteria bacterium]|nr:NADH-quinone oxidoreductase subunit L [Deltaproteobacteria bacterium]